MAGPWEDYSAPAQQEEAGPWSDFAPAKPTVKPGDVAARKAQVDALAAAEAPNQVRERVGGQDTSSVGGFLKTAPLAIAREVGSGLSEAGSGFLDMLTGRTGNRILPSELSAKGIMESPLAKVGLGAVRAVGAPLAPVANAAAVAGEDITKALADLGLQTGADVAGALTEAAGNVLAPMGISKATSALKAKVPAQPRVKAAALEAEGAAKTADIQAAGAQADEALRSRTKTAIEQEKQLRDVQLKEGRDQIAKADADLAAIEAKRAALTKDAQASTQAYEESILSFTNAEKASIPKGSDVRARLAANAPTGEKVGGSFKETYAKRLGETKASFNEEYNSISQGSADVSAEANNYKDAIQSTLGEKGVSRPLPTRAEQAASKAKSALEVDAEAADTVSALTKATKEARDPASKRMAQDALDEFMAASEVGDNPTLADLIKERARLKGGQRAAFQAKDDNLARQFTNLVGGIEADINAVSPDTLTRLRDVGERYVKEYVPYFSKNAAPRAIAEGEASTVVDQIVRPASDRKAVEKVTRAFEMIGNDPAQKQAVAKAFMNKGIEDAFTSGEFDAKKFVGFWDKYANPAGNANRVLKTALGDSYADAEHMVKTLRTVKPKTIDEAASTMLEGVRKEGASRVKAISEEEAARAAGPESYLKSAPRLMERGVKEANAEIVGLNRKMQAELRAAGKSREAQIGVIQKGMKEEIEKLVGKPMGESGAGRFIGQLYLSEAGLHLATGNAGAAAAKAVMGAGLVISRAMFSRMMEMKRGRSMLISAMNTSLGTTKAAAQARQIMNFAERIKAND